METSISPVNSSYSSQIKSIILNETFLDELQTTLKVIRTLALVFWLVILQLSEWITQLVTFTYQLGVISKLKVVNWLVLSPNPIAAKYRELTTNESSSQS